MNEYPYWWDTLPAVLAGSQKSEVGSQSSTLPSRADVVVVLPGVSPKVRGDVRQITSVQPMGSAFEQITALTCDAVVLELMQRTEQTSEDMFARHADLE